MIRCEECGRISGHNEDCIHNTVNKGGRAGTEFF